MYFEEEDDFNEWMEDLEDSDDYEEEGFIKGYMESDE